MAKKKKSPSKFVQPAQQTMAQQQIQPQLQQQPQFESTGDPELDQIIQDYLANNPGATPEDIQGVIADYRARKEEDAKIIAEQEAEKKNLEKQAQDALNQADQAAPDQPEVIVERFPDGSWRYQGQEDIHNDMVPAGATIIDLTTQEEEDPNKEAQEDQALEQANQVKAQQAQQIAAAGEPELAEAMAPKNLAQFQKLRSEVKKNVASMRSRGVSENRIADYVEEIKGQMQEDFGVSPDFGITTPPQKTQEKAIEEGRANITPKPVVDKTIAELSDLGATEDDIKLYKTLTRQERRFKRHALDKMNQMKRSGATQDDIDAFMYEEMAKFNTEFGSSDEILYKYRNRENPNLTDDQEAQLNEIVQDMTDGGATAEEIEDFRNNYADYLSKMGKKDEEGNFIYGVRIDNEATKRLSDDIKSWRDDGLSKSQIHGKIAEFVISNEDDKNKVEDPDFTNQKESILNRFRQGEYKQAEKEGFDYWKEKGVLDPAKLGFATNPEDIAIKRRRAEIIPDWARGSYILEGAHKLATNLFPQAIEGIQIAGKGAMFQNAKDELAVLESKLKDGTLSPEAEVRVGGSFMQSSGTWSGGKMMSVQDAIDHYKKQINFYPREILDKVSNIQELQSQLDAYHDYDPFDEDGMTWNDVKSMVGEQLPQLAITTLTFGAGAFAQEYGHSYIENLNAIAKQKFGKDDPNYIATKEDLLDIIENGEDQVDVAITVGAAAAALEYVGAKNIVNSAMGKSFMRSILRGNLKRVMNTVPGKIVGTSLEGAFVESLTEGAQGLAQDIGRGVASNTPFHFDPRKTATEMVVGGTVGFVLPFVGGSTRHSYRAFVNPTTGENVILDSKEADKLRPDLDKDNLDRLDQEINEQKDAREAAIERGDQETASVIAQVEADLKQQRADAETESNGRIQELTDEELSELKNTQDQIDYLEESKGKANITEAEINAIQKRIDKLKNRKGDVYDNVKSWQATIDNVVGQSKVINDRIIQLYADRSRLESATSGMNAEQRKEYNEKQRAKDEAKIAKINEVIEYNTNLGDQLWAQAGNLRSGRDAAIKALQFKMEEFNPNDTKSLERFSKQMKSLIADRKKITDDIRDKNLPKRIKKSKDIIQKELSPERDLINAKLEELWNNYENTIKEYRGEAKSRGKGQPSEYAGMRINEYNKLTDAYLGDRKILVGALNKINSFIKDGAISYLPDGSIDINPLITDGLTGKSKMENARKITGTPNKESFVERLEETGELPIAMEAKGRKGKGSENHFGKWKELSKEDKKKYASYGLSEQTPNFTADDIADIQKINLAIDEINQKSIDLLNKVNKARKAANLPTQKEFQEIQRKTNGALNDLASIYERDNLEIIARYAPRMEAKFIDEIDLPGTPTVDEARAYAADAVALRKALIKRLETAWNDESIVANPIDEMLARSEQYNIIPKYDETTGRFKATVKGKYIQENIVEGRPTLWSQDERLNSLKSSDFPVGWQAGDPLPRSSRIFDALGYAGYGTSEYISAIQGAGIILGSQSDKAYKPSTGYAETSNGRGKYLQAAARALTLMTSEAQVNGEKFSMDRFFQAIDPFGKAITEFTSDPDIELVLAETRLLAEPLSKQGVVPVSPNKDSQEVFNSFNNLTDALHLAAKAYTLQSQRGGNTTVSEQHRLISATVNKIRKDLISVNNDLAEAKSILKNTDKKPQDQWNEQDFENDRTLPKEINELQKKFDKEVAKAKDALKEHNEQYKVLEEVANKKAKEVWDFSGGKLDNFLTQDERALKKIEDRIEVFKQMAKDVAPIVEKLHEQDQPIPDSINFGKKIVILGLQKKVLADKIKATKASRKSGITSEEIGKGSLVGLFGAEEVKHGTSIGKGKLAGMISRGQLYQLFYEQLNAIKKSEGISDQSLKNDDKRFQQFVDDKRSLDKFKQDNYLVDTPNGIIKNYFTTPLVVKHKGEAITRDQIADMSMDYARLLRESHRAYKKGAYRLAGDLKAEAQKMTTAYPMIYVQGLVKASPADINKLRNLTDSQINKLVGGNTASEVKKNAKLADLPLLHRVLNGELYTASKLIYFAQSLAGNAKGQDRKESILQASDYYGSAFLGLSEAIDGFLPENVKDANYVRALMKDIRNKVRQRLSDLRNDSSRMPINESRKRLQTLISNAQDYFFDNVGREPTYQELEILINYRIPAKYTGRSWKHKGNVMVMSSPNEANKYVFPGEQYKKRETIRYEEGEAGYEWIRGNISEATDLDRLTFQGTNTAIRLNTVEGKSEKVEERVIVDVEKFVLQKILEGVDGQTDETRPKWGTYYTLKTIRKAVIGAKEQNTSENDENLEKQGINARAEAVAMDTADFDKFVANANTPDALSATIFGNDVEALTDEIADVIRKSPVIADSKEVQDYTDKVLNSGQMIGFESKEYGPDLKATTLKLKKSQDKMDADIAEIISKYLDNIPDVRDKNGKRIGGFKRNTDYGSFANALNKSVLAQNPFAFDLLANAKKYFKETYKQTYAEHEYRFNPETKKVERLDRRENYTKTPYELKSLEELEQWKNSSRPTVESFQKSLRRQAEANLREANAPLSEESVQGEMAAIKGNLGITGEVNSQNVKKLIVDEAVFKSERRPVSTGEFYKNFVRVLRDELELRAIQSGRLADVGRLLNEFTIPVYENSGAVKYFDFFNGGWQNSIKYRPIAEITADIIRTKDMITNFDTDVDNTTLSTLEDKLQRLEGERSQTIQFIEYMKNPPAELPNTVRNFMPESIMNRIRNKEVIAGGIDYNISNGLATGLAGGIMDRSQDPQMVEMLDNLNKVREVSQGTAADLINDAANKIEHNDSKSGAITDIVNEDTGDVQSNRPGSDVSFMEIINEAGQNAEALKQEKADALKRLRDNLDLKGLIQSNSGRFFRKNNITEAAMKELQPIFEATRQDLDRRGDQLSIDVIQKANSIIETKIVKGLRDTKAEASNAAIVGESVINGVKNPLLAESSAENAALLITAQLAKQFPNVNVKIVSQPQMEDLVETWGYAKDKATQIKGFTRDGVVYINRANLDVEAPIHEFGHIWVDDLKTSNKDLYNKGIELVKRQKKLLDAITKAAKNPESVYSGKSETELQEEALATAIGQHGRKLQFRKNDDKASWLKWVKDTWSFIQGKLGTQESFDNMTWNQFLDVAVAEMTTSAPTYIKTTPTRVRTALQERAKLLGLKGVWANYKRYGIRGGFANILAPASNDDFRGLLQRLLPTKDGALRKEFEKVIDETLIQPLNQANYDKVEAQGQMQLMYDELKTKAFGKSMSNHKADGRLSSIAKGITIEGYKLSNSQVVMLYNYLKDPTLYSKMQNGGVDLTIMNQIADYINASGNEDLKMFADGYPEIFKAFEQTVSDKLDKFGFKPLKATKINQKQYSTAELEIMKKVFDGKIPENAVYTPFAGAVDIDRKDLIKSQKVKAKRQEAIKQSHLVRLLKEKDRLENLIAEGKDTVSNEDKLGGIELNIAKAQEALDAAELRTSILDREESGADMFGILTGKLAPEDAYSVMADNLKQRQPYGSLDFVSSNTDSMIQRYQEGPLHTISFIGFAKNAAAFFNNDNLKNAESKLGAAWAGAMRDSLRRIISGSNAPATGSKESNWIERWLNRAVGSTMFFNMRSALLQMLSTPNFMMDNPIGYAAQLGDPKGLREAFKLIMNSGFIRMRGMQSSDVVLSDMERQKGKDPASIYIDRMLRKGYAPTKFADRRAIGIGGAPYVAMRIAQLKKGFPAMPIEEVHAIAMRDFVSKASEAQQSTNPDRLGKMQTGRYGKYFLTYLNATQQFTRKIAYSLRDAQAGNNIGNNAFNILYLVGAQMALFTFLQKAMWMHDMDDDEEDWMSYFQSVADTVISSTGVPGAVISSIGTAAVAAANAKKQYKKAAFIQAILDASPAAGQKAREFLKAAGITPVYKDSKAKFDAEVVQMAYALQATLGIPVARILRKYEGMYDTFQGSDLSAWERVLRAMGYSRYDLEAKLGKRKGGTPILKLDNHRLDFDTAFGFNKKDESPLAKIWNSPAVKVKEKVDSEPGVLGRANKDGTVEINPNLSPAMRKKVLAHEGQHAKDLESGRLDYTDEYVKWDGVEYPRKDGKIKLGKKWVIEGDKSLPWEAAADKAENNQ